MTEYQSHEPLHRVGPEAAGSEQDYSFTHGRNEFFPVAPNQIAPESVDPDEARVAAMTAMAREAAVAIQPGSSEFSEEQELDPSACVAIVTTVGANIEACREEAA